MREKRTTQTSLFDPQSIEHPIANDLEAASAWLDAHPELLDAVIADLDAGTGSGRGRHGLTAQTMGYVEAAIPKVRAARRSWSGAWVASAQAYLDLLDRVCAQTERRVFDGETVPDGEKVVR